MNQPRSTLFYAIITIFLFTLSCPIVIAEPSPTKSDIPPAAARYTSHLPSTLPPGPEPTSPLICPDVIRYTSHLPSPATPDPIYATSTPRPLIRAASRLTSLNFPWFADHNFNAGYMKYRCRESLVGELDAWFYFTTSDYSVRNNVTAMFDAAFEEMVPLPKANPYRRITPAPPPGIPLIDTTTYGWVDCGDEKDRWICEDGIDSVMFSRGGWTLPLKQVNIRPKEKLKIEAPGLLHVGNCQPAHYGLETWRDVKYTRGRVWRYWKFPLEEEMGWRRRVKIGSFERDGEREVEAPAFLSPREQMRSIMAAEDSGRAVKERCTRKKGFCQLWEGDSEWMVTAEPYTKFREGSGILRVENRNRTVMHLVPKQTQSGGY